MKYEPTRTMVELSKIKNVDLCLASKTPTLAELRKEGSEDEVLTMLQLWIIDIGEFFNFNNKMNPAQIKQASVMVLQDFYYFKIADINYIFNSAKKGRYGEMYGSIDGSKIYKWFEMHDIERSGTRYNEALRKHDVERQNEASAKMLKENTIGK
jgi:hypothetical protein